MSVQQGLDPDQITTIANQLASEGDRLEHVHQSGTVMLATLAGAWAGDDLARFHVTWQHHAPRIDAMATALRAAAKELHQQAQDQIRGSGQSATGGSGGSTQGHPPQVTNPWNGVTDFGKGLLLPSTGVVDTAKEIAARTGDGIREGVDRTREGINEGIDRAREGMDWLDDRADQARDWGHDKAERLTDVALDAAEKLLFTGSSGLAAAVAMGIAERVGLVNDGHGEAGEIVGLEADGKAVGSHPGIRQPTSLSEIMLGTTDAYKNDGHVRITEITRPDGSTAYIVNTPGSQFNSKVTDNPLDTLGNLATVHGDSSASSEAVWAAMEKAGIPPGSPILMAGHSQGGMINQTLMSDPRFMERFNVTHSVTYGSPVDSIPDTSGVRQIHLQHADDIVPRVDMGNLPKPSRLSDDATVVTLDNPPGVYDAKPVENYGLGQPISWATGDAPGQPVEDVLGAHSHKNYAESVANSQDPAISSFEDDLDEFIVPAGDASKVTGADVEIRRRK